MRRLLDKGRFDTHLTPWALTGQWGFCSLEPFSDKGLKMFTVRRQSLCCQFSSATARQMLLPGLGPNKIRKQQKEYLCERRASSRISPHGKGRTT
jgi:hypothetical protein